MLGWVGEMGREKTKTLTVGLGNRDRAMARPVYGIWAANRVEEGTVHTLHDVLAGAAVVFQSNSPRPAAAANER